MHLRLTTLLLLSTSIVLTGCTPSPDDTPALDPQQQALDSLKELGATVHLESGADVTLVNLRTLRLAGTRTTDAGLTHLANLTKLETLDVSRTNVTEQGLSKLRGLDNLTRIIDHGTDITDKAALPGVQIELEGDADSTPDNSGG